MKYTYTKKSVSLLFLLLLHNILTAQCPMGEPAGSTAYDTTIAFPTGTTSIPVKFPQFDPQAGMVTCVRLCVTITGIIDTLAMQNFAASPQTGTFNYIRNDQIVGPGIITPLSNSVNLTYGPFNLTAYDGIPGAGTDFHSQANDTILNEVLCRTISDSATIVQFYGLDSVTYNYDIDVTTNATITGGSSSTLVLTSALVNFRFEYCTCPIVTLPLNILHFKTGKVAESTALLQWEALDDSNKDYWYEVEVSRDGQQFSAAGRVAKMEIGIRNLYKFLFTAPSAEAGLYYFRIKQVYNSEYYRFSDIKSVDLKSSAFTGFSLYPNPSDGIVGIKFDNNEGGEKIIELFSIHGQRLMQKEITVTGSSYHRVATLQSGLYWIRVTDVSGQLHGVSQLFIQ